LLDTILISILFHRFIDWRVWKLSICVLLHGNLCYVRWASYPTSSIFTGYWRRGGI